MDIAQNINGLLRPVPVWLLYVVGPLPGLITFYLGLTGGLGPEPINALERDLGEFALQLFILVIAITPLRNWTGINLIKFRRALGLLVFFYVTTHLAVWLFLDVQDPAAIWKDIVKRPFVTIGFASFLIMVPLAVTSNNRSLRRLGPVVWRKLHWLTYPAVALGGVHYVWLVKGWPLEPLIYLAVIVGLLATRLRLGSSLRGTAGRA